ncbi:MAG: DnaB-like helicase C-terminal domain-containing protein [Phenylobacterium sp.]
MIENRQKIQLEREFINLLLKNKNLVYSWVEDGPQSNFFDKVHYAILDAIYYAFTDNDSILTKRIFNHYLKSNGHTKIDIASQESLFDIVSIMSTKEDDFSVLKVNIIEGYLEQQSVLLLDEFRKDIKNKGSIFATGQLKDSLNNLIDTSTFETRKVFYDPITSLHKDFLVELKARQSSTEEDKIIRTHINEIDFTMRVGLAPGTLTLFTADVSGFKSTMMLNIAINAWELSGARVLFVPLEMPREIIYKKLVSRQTRIPFDKLENPKLLTEAENKILDELADGWNDNFFIMDAPERVPVSLIKREIEKNLSRFKPDVVVIDYIANLVPDANAKNDRPDLVIGDMLKALRTLGRRNVVHENGFATISGAQLGRDALKRVRKLGTNQTSFHSEDLRGSHEYSADADVIYAQMPDPQQPESRLHFYVIKSRYGVKTFMDGARKAILEVQGDIGLIKSMNSNMFNEQKEEILAKVDHASLDFDDLLKDENTESELSNNYDAVDVFNNKNSINDDLSELLGDI